MSEYSLEKLESGGYATVYKLGNSAVKLFDDLDAHDGDLYKELDAACSIPPHANLCLAKELLFIKSPVTNHKHPALVFELLTSNEEHYLYNETIADLANALNHIHEAGFVHLDVRDENIMFRDGVPVIIDFGMCKRLNFTSTDSSYVEEHENIHVFSKNILDSSNYTSVASLGVNDIHCMSKKTDIFMFGIFVLNQYFINDRVRTLNEEDAVYPEDIEELVADVINCAIRQSHEKMHRALMKLAPTFEQFIEKRHIRYIIDFIEKCFKGNLRVLKEHGFLSRYLAEEQEYIQPVFTSHKNAIKLSSKNKKIEHLKITKIENKNEIIEFLIKLHKKIYIPSDSVLIQSMALCDRVNQKMTSELQFDGMHFENLFEKQKVFAGVVYLICAQFHFDSIEKEEVMSRVKINDETFFKIHCHVLSALNGRLITKKPLATALKNILPKKTVKHMINFCKNNDLTAY